MAGGSRIVRTEASLDGVKWINATLTRLFDLLLWPFRSLDPIWGLLLVSMLAGVMMLWLFGKVSNQKVIRVVRDKIRGNLIAVRLFGDDLGLLFRLQGRILLQTASYLRHAIVPMLILLVPVAFVLAQLHLRFESRPLEAGKPTVITAQLHEGASLRSDVALEVPEGVVVETPPVKAVAAREVSWRIRPERDGTFTLTVRNGDGDAVEKDLRVGGRWADVSQRRTGAGIWDSFLYPGEPPIPRDSSIARIDVRYPSQDITVFGFSLHWILIFLVASLAFGFAMKKPLKVEI